MQGLGGTDPLHNQKFKYNFTVCRFKQPWIVSHHSTYLVEKNASISWHMMYSSNPCSRINCNSLKVPWLYIECSQHAKDDANCFTSIIQFFPCRYGQIWYELLMKTSSCSCWQGTSTWLGESQALWWGDQRGLGRPTDSSTWTGRGGIREGCQKEVTRKQGCHSAIT